MKMKSEYKALKAVAFICSLLGGLAFLVCFLVLFLSLIQLSSANQAIVAIVPMTIIMVSGLLLYGIGELIKLLLESVSNGRKTNEYLKYLAEKNGYQE
jgi:hypothetical protein